MDSPPPPYHHSPVIPFVTGTSAPHSTSLLAPATESTRIQAYARLEFSEGIDFYIRTLSVTIGRRPLAGQTLEVPEGQRAIERSPLLRPVSDARSSPPTLDAPSEPQRIEMKEEAPPVHVDVDLGPIKAVSRDHARLFYDYTSCGWMLEVRGRNGVVIDGHWHSKGESVGMQDGTRIQIAERVFYFMLPNQLQASGELEDDDSATDYTSDRSASPPAGLSPVKRGKAVLRGRGGARRGGGSVKIKLPAREPTVELKKLPARINRGKGKAKDDYYEHSYALEASELSDPRRSRAPSMQPVKIKKPLVFPSNEHVGKEEKPPYTMTSLIAQAISHTEGEQATIHQVTTWLKAAYPFFATMTGLQAEIDRRMRDTRFFVFEPPSRFSLLADDDQPQYFDGTVYRKRAAAKVDPPTSLEETPPVASMSALPAKTSTAPAAETEAIPIVIEALPADYDPATAPTVAGLDEPPIAIHQGRMILSPSVFKHLLKDTAKFDTLKRMPTDKAIAALRQFVVAYLKARAAKAEKRKAEEAASGEPDSKVAKQVSF